MGYSNVVVRVHVDVLGPLYVLPGPLADSIRFCLVWDVQA